MKNIPITDAMIAGAISIERSATHIQPWRIPYQRQEYYYNLIGLAQCGAGVRLQLESDSTQIQLSYMPLDAHRRFDLCVNNEIVHSIMTEPQSNTVSFDLSGFDGQAFDIWLCNHTAIQVCALAIDDNASCTARSDKRIKWLTYGSSITQCSSAHSPARTWPGTAARKLDLHLSCLGFSGNCMLETGVARMISKQEADIITLKLGINVQGQGSLNKRTYQPAVMGLIELIREEHPSTPIGVITSIYSTHREDGPNVIGMSLKDYRAETEEAVRRVKSYGDPNIEIFDGLSVFGADLVKYLPDDLHPDGDGYEILGNNIADSVLAPMLKKYGLK